MLLMPEMETAASGDEQNRAQNRKAQSGQGQRDSN